METIIVTETAPEKPSLGLALRYHMRKTPLGEWLTNNDLKDRLSGTLRKNARLGFKYGSQLREEALAQVLGYGFESAPTTYITFNDAVTEGDCHALTEVGWHVDRMIYLNIFESDEYILKYINIQDAEGNLLRQGVGVILRQTGITWIPKSHLVFSLLAEYDSQAKQWSRCINPF